MSSHRDLITRATELELKAKELRELAKGVYTLDGAKYAFMRRGSLVIAPDLTLPMEQFGKFTRWLKSCERLGIRDSLEEQELTPAHQEEAEDEDDEEWNDEE